MGGRRDPHVSLFVFIAVLIGNTAPSALAGAPLYPDIITLPPSGSTSNAIQPVITWSDSRIPPATLVADSKFPLFHGSKEIYQNVYDQNVGGNRITTSGCNLT